MRKVLLAALVAAAPLAWCESAGAQVLAQVSDAIAGWRSGGSATGVQLMLSFSAHDTFDPDAALFDQVTWTPADVGRVVSIGCSFDDPQFAQVSATLTNGLPDSVYVQASILPGEGGPGMGTSESNFFLADLAGSVDFAGSTVDAIALRLDALTLDQPTEGSVDLRFTLFVIGSADGSDDSPELAQCTADLEEARLGETECLLDYTHLLGDYELLRQGLEGCEDRYGEELARAHAALVETRAELTAAQTELADAQAALSGAQIALSSAQAELAAAIADLDADGVRDPGDSCLGTASAAAVDGVGCSLAQFCSAIDATTGTGRSTCNHADWRNDEPLSDSPNDCKASGGVCLAR